MNRRKNTLAIFFSFALITALLTALLILIHTNHRLESLQNQMMFTSSDCCVEGLDEGQVKRLIAKVPTDWYAIEQAGSADYSRNAQSLYIVRGDARFLTLTSHLEAGKLPDGADEVAAERWALMNIGIEPVCGQMIRVHNEEKNCDETYRLVGILSDIAANKTYGVKHLYAPVQMTEGAEYNVYIRLPGGTSYKEQTERIHSLPGFSEISLTQCPGREDFDELKKIDRLMVSVLFVIGSVIFYGVYRIALIARKKEYGIYRALGMTKRQLRFMILRELYQIFLAGVPAGFAAGSGMALLIIQMSGDQKQEIYLNNVRVSFSAVFPVSQIFLGICLLALVVGAVGLLAGVSVVKQTVPVLLSGETAKGKDRGRFLLRDSYGRNMTLLCLGNKYLLRDKAVSLLVILTICIGTVLFTGLYYHAQSSRLFRADTKEMQYLNGQYEMGILHLDTMTDGITQSDVSKIQESNAVTRVKYMAGFPIRVIDDVSVKRNNAYYNDLNQRFIKYNEYPLIGNDGTADVYSSVIYGYNRYALEELKKYVIEGDFQVDGLQEDEIILSVLRTDDTKENQNPGNYREGTPLMDYHAGDSIRIRYRNDFDTSSMEYKQMTDDGQAYTERTYRVAAIVSFPYMYDSNRTVLPLLITSIEQVKKICPDYHIQQLYIDCAVSSAASQDKLERELIQIGSRNRDVSTRSRISDIQKNNMLFVRHMVYIFSTAVVTFILVLISIENNLKYRMQVRTREIVMYRSIGMNINMIRRMMLWENGILGFLGILCGYAAANPLLQYLYRQSQRQAFAHPYGFAYGAFFCIAVLIMALCLMLSVFLTREWKTKRVV